jgi:hypothetical protein
LDALRASQSAAAQAFELETEEVIGLLCDEELIGLDESAPAS